MPHIQPNTRRAFAMAVFVWAVQFLSMTIASGGFPDTRTAWVIRIMFPTAGAALTFAFWSGLSKRGDASLPTMRGLLVAVMLIIAWVISLFIFRARA